MFVVFDLDGTLADPTHRLHFIRGEPRDYDAFYAACPGDTPRPRVIGALYAHVAAGHRVEIWSGRSDAVRAETEAWLRAQGIDPGRLTHMRPAGDHQVDAALKRAWLRTASPRPDLTYDDRDSVVAMWREEGIECFQVAPGPH
jgi:hypothetical protein